MIAAHFGWHKHARYIEADPKLLAKTLAGEFDHLNDVEDYAPAVTYIKNKHKVAKFNKNHDKVGRFAVSQGGKQIDTPEF